jgi:hypothetical protein
MGIILSSAGLTEQGLIDSSHDRSFRQGIQPEHKSTRLTGAEVAATDDRRWIDHICLGGHARHGHSWPYCLRSDQAALRSCTRTWAAEFKDRSIRANTLSRRAKREYIARINR